ncbi:MAG: flippase-like domain-containing protein, partial [Acidobacteria bacterium]|nr:flippase-like domain-containing protein [Acidobacteriota bacterium]
GQEARGEGLGIGKETKGAADEEKGSDRLKPAAAFRAILVGEALGNLTPLGLIISEPAKAAFVRRAVPISSGLPALAIETIFYSVSAAIVIGCGMALLLGLFNIPAAIRVGGYAALACVAIVLGVTALVMGRRWRPASAALRVVLPASLAVWIAHVGDVEDRIYGFARRHPGRLPAIAALEFLFHVAGVAEAYFVLLWLGAPVTVVTAFVLEAVNRIVNVLFRFVPLRLGVDEAGSGLLTHVLGFGAPTGVSLAIIRKARVLVWSAVGLALLTQRAWGARNRPI